MDLLLNRRRMLLNAEKEEYIVFADPEVGAFCAANWGDGVGITPSQAARVTSIPARKFWDASNKNAFDSFDEFSEFVNVQTLGANAFRALANMTTIQLPQSITAIGGNCFYISSKLSMEIDLPNLTSLGKSAFYSTKITRIVDLGKITSIPGDNNGMFQGCTTLTDVVLPSTLLTIGNNAFRACTNLLSVSFPQSITTIGTYAFYSDSKLTGDVNLPNLSSLGTGAFRDAAITSVSSLGTITSLPNEAFWNCKLTRIVLPSTLTSIGSNAMRTNSGGQMTVTSHATTPPTVGSNAFYGTSIGHIYVPSESVEDYKAAAGWSAFASVIEAIPSN